MLKFYTGGEKTSENQKRNSTYEHEDVSYRDMVMHGDPPHWSLIAYWSPASWWTSSFVHFLVGYSSVEKIHSPSFPMRHYSWKFSHGLKNNWCQYSLLKCPSFMLGFWVLSGCMEIHSTHAHPQTSDLLEMVLVVEQQHQSVSYHTGYIVVFQPGHCFPGWLLQANAAFIL